MVFWIGLAVLGFVVTVLIVESRPVRRRRLQSDGRAAAASGPAATAVPTPAAVTAAVAGAASTAAAVAEAAATVGWRRLLSQLPRRVGGTRQPRRGSRVVAVGVVPEGLPAPWSGPGGAAPVIA